jgi:Ca-activated chloride channel family protein
MIKFLYIDVLYMLLLPLVLLIVLVLTNKDNIQQHFSKEIFEKLKVGRGVLGKSTRNGLLFFSLILFIIALSRPVMDEKEQEVKQKLIPIVIAYDLSKSMDATDIYPNRKALAKKKLKSIINYAKNATIGVILFAKDTYVLSPITEDFLSLNYIVDNLDISIEIENGSSIGAVLESTNHMLSDYKVKNLIILSDGGNNQDYEDELEFAKKNNISVYSIGVATKKGSPIPLKDGYMTDKEGRIVNVKLNESIKNLSLESGGGYIDFSLSDDDVKAIIDRINSQSKKEELKSQKFKIYTELFYYPLAFGIFIFFLATSSLPSRGNSVVVFLLFCFYLLPNKALALEFEFENINKAKEYYEKKEYGKAADEYRKISSSAQNYYNLANSLYKSGKYKEAIKTYEKIVTDDNNLEYQKLYNMGNSFVKSNDLQKAKEFYEKALKLKNDKETKENLELVNKELEKQKKKQDQKNKENKDDKKKDEKKDQKDQNSSKKNKENKDQDKKQKEDQKNDSQKNKKDEKKDQEKKKDDKQKGTQGESKNQKQNMKKQPISDMEEAKWMKKLNDKKTPIFLQKMKTNKGNGDEQPW